MVLCGVLPGTGCAGAAPDEEAAVTDRLISSWERSGSRLRATCRSPRSHVGSAPGPTCFAAGIRSGSGARIRAQEGPFPISLVGPVLDVSRGADTRGRRGCPRPGRSRLRAPHSLGPPTGRPGHALPPGSGRSIRGREPPVPPQAERTHPKHGSGGSSLRVPTDTPARSPNGRYSSPSRSGATTNGVIRLLDTFARPRTSKRSPSRGEQQETRCRSNPGIPLCA